MKKRIAIFTIILLLFAFLCSVPASAYVTDFDPNSEDWVYNYSDTFSLKQYDKVRVSSVDQLWYLNEVDYLTFNNYGYDTWSFQLTPYLFYWSDYNDYFALSYASFRQDRKYVLTLEFDLESDGSYISDAYPYFESFYISDFVNGTDVKVNGGHYKMTTTFRTSDFASDENLFENGDVTSGEMRVDYLYFNISGIKDYSSVKIYNIRYSCKVYEESSAITDEDYGYDGNEEESQTFADKVLQFNAQITNLWLKLDDFKAYLRSDGFDFLDSLEPYKNFVQDIYNFIPDYVEYLISFVLGFLVLRRFIGR